MGVVGEVAMRYLFHLLRIDNLDTPPVYQRYAVQMAIALKPVRASQIVDAGPQYRPESGRFSSVNTVRHHLK